jgi:hypothetical protein
MTHPTANDNKPANQKKPYRFQEFPKVLYLGDDAHILVNNEADEEAAIEKGYTATAPLPPHARPVAAQAAVPAKPAVPAVPATATAPAIPAVPAVPAKAAVPARTPPVTKK